MMVKICGITNLEDALAAVDARAAAIGYIFYPRSPRHINPEDAAKISAALPPSIKKVGVFVDEKPREIERIARISGIDIAQLHGHESPARVPRSLRVWKAFRVTPEWSPQAMSGFAAEAFLLDSAMQGEPFDWNRAKGLETRIILGGGLDESNVEEAIRTVRPWGVDASSRLERRPGVKDPEKVRRFVQRALSTCT